MTIEDVIDTIRQRIANSEPSFIYEDEALTLIAQLEQHKKALRVAAGVLSTYPPHTNEHPQDVYDWLIKESQYETGE